MINCLLRTIALFALVIFFHSCSSPKNSSGGASVEFKKNTLSNEYISEGVAVADVNKDGRLDVLAGSFWWEAPDWKRHEITTPYIHPSMDGYGNSFLNFAMDVNQDGWTDQIKIGLPGEKAFWYENPKNQPGHWKERLVYHSVGNESPALVDIDGDGREDLLCNDAVEKKVVWLSAPASAQDTVWQAHVISNDSTIATHKYTHGLGLGDINGDRRKDVIVKNGWWEGPADPKQSDWTFHQTNLGEDCSQMYAFDFDGDGDNDVVSASGHKFGIWWHEQQKGGDSINFTTHQIDSSFSQTHGMAFDDINDDGHPDLITGKRVWAHNQNGTDPGEKDPAVIYWFEFKPGKQPVWTGHEIDNNSGVGLNIAVTDMNNDKMKDIVVANKKGVFIFERTKK